MRNYNALFSYFAVLPHYKNTSKKIKIKYSHYTNYRQFFLPEPPLELIRAIFLAEKLFIRKQFKKKNTKYIVRFAQNLKI